MNISFNPFTVPYQRYHRILIHRPYHNTLDVSNHLKSPCLIHLLQGDHQILEALLRAKLSARYLVATAGRCTPHSLETSNERNSERLRTYLT